MKSIGKYKIGFWNYRPLGEKDIIKSVDEWKELGFNLPMSFVFDKEKSSEADMLKLLDYVCKKDMMVILYDKRLDFHNLEKITEDEYRKSAEDSFSMFSNHPAVWGFTIGDEPRNIEFDVAEKAYSICKSVLNSKDKVLLLNFFPLFLEDSFQDILARDESQYEKMLSDYIKKTNSPMISYDYYGQGCYFDREYYVDLYFRNLNMYSRISQKENVELFTSLLSVGHWAYVVPNEDLIRWQLNTSIAHGVVGILWFYLYTSFDNNKTENYRLAAYDQYNYKTPTYDYLRRQNNIFMDLYAKKLERLTFKKVSHYSKTFGGSEVFHLNNEIVKISYPLQSQPLSFTEFEDDKGNISYWVVNLSQDYPVCVDIVCGGDLEKNSGRYYFAPGQAFLLENNKTFGSCGK